MKQKLAFLVLSDKPSDSVIQLYESISSATKHTGDTFLLYHQHGDQLPEVIRCLNHFAFDDSVLSKLNYIPIGFKLVPGNNHFPLLKFAASNPNYDYYWCIEEDVRFTGHWDFFFDSFAGVSKSLITSHIHTSADEPQWYWWHTLANPYQIIPFEKRIRSFNPIYRISNEALRFIHRSLCDFWCGHHEVLLPTLLHYNGFEIMDFGGDGPFVPPGHNNRFYIDNTPNKQGSLVDGTMRWRPIFKEPGGIQDKLYHPVKA